MTRAWWSKVEILKKSKYLKKLSKIWFLDGKWCLLLHRLQITTKLLFNGTKFALTATYHPVQTIRGYIRGGWRLAPTNSYCAHYMYTKWTWILHKTYSTFSRYNNHSTHFFVFFKKKESFVLQKSAAEIQGINNDAIVPILCMNFVGLLKFAQTKFPKT